MEKRDSKFSFKMVWGIIMVCVYLGMAYLIVFSPLFNELSPISKTVRVVIAILFSIYGLYRGYRLWKNYFNNL